MSNASRSLATSDEQERVGPDYFGYYLREVKNLLSEDKDLLPSGTSKPPRGRHRERREKKTIQHSDDYSGSLYCNGIGPDLSDSRKERLRLLLRQGAFALSSEVDEMLEPALATYYLQSRLRSKRHSSHHIVASSNDHAVQAPCKKFKGSENNCTDSESRDMALSDKGITNVETSCQKSEGKELPNCKAGAAEHNGDDFQSGYKIDLEKENGEVNDYLRFLLENGGVEVEEVVKKHSDELYGQLECMEQQLESLLDAVMSKCRPMTLTEKQQLQKQLKKLPPRNLDRVAELICRSKAGEKQSCDDIFVDPEKEDNTTLWRLYYYAEAVDKAKSIVYSQEV
ncbi:hypothetical protein L6164_005049 [Bauhinia variegata]|uniref:Uncharacterized protein n=1 Tax=Bauhinia variegata TaxID=167791 RepID=A0ACB9PRF7_BAUVA|nr:hypothetical protein L6164_005049 [Bauhinia variegata]